MQVFVYHQLTSENNFPITRNAPFQHAVWSVSCPDTHNIAPWYGHKRRLKRAHSEHRISQSALHNMVYDKIVKAERALEMFDFIFLYISFAILFCQKKSRKTVSLPSGFSLKPLTSGALITIGSLHMLRGDGHAFASTRIFHHVMFARLQSV